MKVTFESIEATADLLNDLKEAYLRERGWRYTSATPNCCWLWIKEINGKRWSAGTDEALAMQNTLE